VAVLLLATLATMLIGAALVPVTPHLGTAPETGESEAHRGHLQRTEAIYTGPLAALLAPPNVCPGGERVGAPAIAQEQTMLCMVQYARQASGLPSLTVNSALEASAAQKSHDMLACQEFSHNACGREFSYWIRASGYMSVSCWHVGENLAWGRAGMGTARAIFIAFLQSDTHRHNMLGEYTSIGIDTRVGNLGWQGTVQVWAQHFGSQC
jgi:uncharacterized protein YkwD